MMNATEERVTCTPDPVLPQPDTQTRNTDQLTSKLAKPDGAQRTAVELSYPAKTGRQRGARCAEDLEALAPGCVSRTDHAAARVPSSQFHLSPPELSPPDNTPSDLPASYQSDLHLILTQPLGASVLTEADKRATHRYLCFSLALLYNVRQLVDTKSLQQCDVQLSAAMLEQGVGCINEMLKPAQQSELLKRTMICCALVDEAAQLLVVFGMNDAAQCNISVGLLETHHHTRSYWEATDQPGRLLSFRALQIFADEIGLQIIHHREGSLLWTHRSLGGDQRTPTVPARKDGLKTPGSSMLTSSRRFAASNPPSREEPTLAPPARRTADLHSPMGRQAAMPDALREWLKRLSTDESLQGTVGTELYRQLKLPAGMDKVTTTSTFLRIPRGGGG